MKIKNYIMGSILFFTLIACALPGPGQPAALPTFDLSTIPTMVVLTANATIKQTATATPPLPGIDRTTLEQLSDQGTKYTDNAVGFEVIFPKGWLTLRPNSEEFNSALEKETIKNEMLRDQMNLDLNDYKPGLDRLYSYPLRPDLKKNFAFGFSGLKWDPDDRVQVNENAMGEFVRGLESAGTIPGFRADTAQVYENTNRVKLIEVGGQFSISDGKGGVIPFYLTSVFFKPTSGSTIRMTFTYLKEYKLEISVDVKSVINSVKLLDL